MQYYGLPKMRTLGESGVDVMVTIFGDFSRFSAKKLAFFLITNVMVTIFGDFSRFSAKKLAFFLNTNVMINFFQNLALA
jgi:hypothetical protein